MKKIWIIILVLIGLGVIIHLAIDPTDDRYDLGELDYAPIDSTKVYCKV